MNLPALADTGSGVINLDQPGSYLHWSIFTVSVANLVLIAVMVVIFGAALLLPFPGRRAVRAASPAAPGQGADAGTGSSGAQSPGAGAARYDDGSLEEDSRMW